MSATVTWLIEDETGCNPTGKAGTLEFDVEFLIETEKPAGDYFVIPARAIVENAACDRILLEGEEPRRPTATEQKNCVSWFFDWLEQHPEEEDELCARGLDINWPTEDDFDDSVDDGNDFSF
jgi:hypothetical protein